MREIKFRAKSLETGKWVYGYLTSAVDSWLKKHHYIEFPMSESKIVNSSTVGQYTGLKDKNGVEIYEGDLLKSTYNDEIDGVDCGIGEVEFYEGIWYVAGEIQNGLYDIDKCNEIEVIGNIYENKELLEEKE